MKLLQYLYTATFVVSTTAFTPIAHQNLHTSKSELAATRRDVLSSAFAAAAATVLVSPNDAIAAGVGSFQGVYSDPKHPKGYRVLVSKGKSAANMELSDGGKDGKVFNLPVKVKGTNLTFDFSPKGGPKGIVGVVASDGKSISFPDGNKWPKLSGVEGVYSDPNHPKGYRVIRKEKGSTLVVELKNDSKAETVLVSAKSKASKAKGVTVTFDFPGGNKLDGSFDNNSITFPDGNKWTKL